MRFASSLVLLAVLLAGCTPVAALPPEPSGAELERLIALELDFQWQFVGLTPDSPRPAVDRIRIVSMAEAESVHKQCLIDAGYDSVRVNSTFGADNYERLAIYTCSAQYPTPPSSLGLFSEEQLDFLYDYFMQVTVPCLEANGVTVADIPSREDFGAPSAQLKQVWIPYYSIEPTRDVAFLMRDRCRYVPEGFPAF